MEKPNDWRQQTPQDQSVAILMAIQGNIENAHEGVITLDQLVNKTRPLLEAMGKLCHWLKPTWEDDHETFEIDPSHRMM